MIDESPPTGSSEEAGSARARPRLSSRARVRRHWRRDSGPGEPGQSEPGRSEPGRGEPERGEPERGEQALVVVHDALGGRSLQLGEREWGVLRQMDGTRDLEGVRRAAARDGVRVSPAHLEGFVRELGRLGLLEGDAAVEGDAAGGAAASTTGMEPAFARDLPVRGLPGYRFACDGTGGCCRSFETVLFTPLEAARARATLPTVREAGQDPRRLFTAERGLEERTLLAVGMCDGACAFLAGDGRCGLHAAAGPRSKPLGCRTFPARFVDVADEIRVVPKPECACVLDRPAGGSGEPLTVASRGSELPRQIFVPRLEAARMGGRRVDPEALRRWSDAVELPPAGVDLAAWCARLADEVAERGPAAVRVEEAGPPERERGATIESARASAQRLLRRAAEWRAPTDLVRRASEWVHEAASRLPERQPQVTDEASERLYLRALFFGVGFDAESVEDDLRRRALRMRLARAWPSAAREHPEARHPLALVEALARGHGLDV